MPRDVNGTYTLPDGNPVVPGTTVESTWANPTMADLAAELTNSLDRTGKGGMLAPFRFVDGTLSQPGLAFVNEVTSGFRRAGAQDVRAVIGSQDVMRWVAGKGQFWADGIWNDFLTQGVVDAQGYAKLHAVQTFIAAQTFAAGIWGNGGVSPSLYFVGQSPDGGLAFQFNADPALTNGTLVSFANGGVQKLAVTFEGALAAPAGGLKVGVSGQVGYLVLGGANGRQMLAYSSPGVLGNFDFGSAAFFSSDLLVGGWVTGASGVGVKIRGYINNGAGVVSTVIDTLNAYTSGAKILSIRNATVEKGFVDFDGSMTVSVGLNIKTPSGTSGWARSDADGALYTVGAAEVRMNTIGSSGLLYNSAGGAQTVRGSMADGATAVGVITNTPSNYANAAALCLSVRNNSVQKFGVGALGEVILAASTPSAPPEGSFWYNSSRAGFLTRLGNVTRILATTLDMMTYFAGKPGNSAVLYRLRFASPVRLPATLTGSQFYVNTNPTATTTLTVKKRTAAGAVTTIGTVAFSTAGAPTVTFAADVDFAAGDAFTVENQAAADATAADFSLSFLGIRL